MLKETPGSPGALASFTPTASSSSLDNFPSESGTNGSSSPCPQKMGTVVAGDSRSCHRRVKSLGYQNESTLSYLFDLGPDGEPPAENGEASEFVLGCEPGGQGHSPTLAEPANHNPVRGDALADLLCD